MACLPGKPGNEHQRKRLEDIDVGIRFFSITLEVLALLYRDISSSNLSRLIVKWRCKLSNRDDFHRGQHTRPKISDSLRLITDDMSLRADLDQRMMAMDGEYSY